jgi:ketosteroid isomerase-like protein
MTEGHVFVDSDGARVAGREAMRSGWTTFFQWFPDYSISEEAVLARGSHVAVFGVARGTYAGDGRQAERKPWKIPAAWLAVVRRLRVAEWRVFANVEAVRKQMEEEVS